MESLTQIIWTNGGCPMTASRGKDILVDGSATLVQSLMEADLIDEYRFLVQPIIMGSGRHFFREGMPTTRLKLVKSKTLDLGVVALTYQPDRQEL